MRMASPHKDSSSSPNVACVKLSSGRKRRGSGGNQKKQLAAPNSAASAKFMSVAPDDLLLEIFLRFQTCQSVMGRATVCKRWCTLIINPDSHNFIRSFIQYHLRKQSLNPSYYPARTTNILFNYSKHIHGPYYEIFSKEPKPKAYDISFMPDREDLAIRAATGDLLLLSQGIRRYFVCNSVTRQWLALPEVPRLEIFTSDDDVLIQYGSAGFAIVRNPVDVEEYRYRYKVVIVHSCHFSANVYNFGAAIFDSEIGQWTAVKNFSFPYPNVIRSSNSAQPTDLEIAITSNGFLHWLDGERKLLCLIVFDPFLLKPRFVQLPAGSSALFSDVQPNVAKYEVRLGAVQGRVRLSLMEQAHTSYKLKVWELDSDSYTWLSVCNLDFKKTIIGTGVMFFVLAFDPNDDNVLFLVRGEQICRYLIGKNKYQMICEFPCNGEPIDVKMSMVARYLKVSTLVHPLWPTTLSLPST